MRRTGWAWAFVGLVLLASCVACGWSALAYDTYRSNVTICREAEVRTSICEAEAGEILVQDMASGVIAVSLCALPLMAGCAGLWWWNQRRVSVLEGEQIEVDENS